MRVVEWVVALTEVVAPLVVMEEVMAGVADKEV